jgi:hypothetical protein
VRVYAIHLTLFGCKNSGEYFIPTILLILNYLSLKNVLAPSTSRP